MHHAANDGEIYLVYSFEVTNDGEIPSITKSSQNLKSKKKIYKKVKFFFFFSEKKKKGKSKRDKTK